MQRTLFAFAVTIGLAFTVASPARADVPPPDSCSGAAGTACNNAGPNWDQVGICTAETCTKVNPGDGGTMEFPCVLCKPASGTTSSTTSSTTASASSGTTSSSSAATASSGAGGGNGTGGGAAGENESSGGCSLRTPSPEGVACGAMLALGLGALVAARRNKR